MSNQNYIYYPVEYLSSYQPAYTSNVVYQPVSNSTILTSKKEKFNIQFPGTIKVFLIILVLAIIFFIFWVIIKPSSDIPKIGITPLPTTGIIVPVDDSDCGRNIVECSSDYDCQTKCGLTGSNNNYTCTTIKSDVYYLGTQLPKGKSFCLPKEASNLNSVCGTYTGRVVRTMDSNGALSWTCQCKYPSMFGGSDCNQPVACRYQFIDPQTGKNTVSYAKLMKIDKNGTPITDSEGKKIYYDPTSPPPDTSPVDVYENDPTKPVWICDCADALKGAISLPNDPYSCHMDRCYSGQGNTKAAQFDTTKNECVCDNTTTFKSNISGFCYPLDTTEAERCVPNSKGMCTCGFSGIIFNQTLNKRIGLMFKKGNNIYLVGKIPLYSFVNQKVNGFNLTGFNNWIVTGSFPGRDGKPVTDKYTVQGYDSNKGTFQMVSGSDTINCSLTPGGKITFNFSESFAAKYCMYPRTITQNLSFDLENNLKVSSQFFTIFNNNSVLYYPGGPTPDTNNCGYNTNNNIALASWKLTSDPDFKTNYAAWRLVNNIPTSKPGFFYTGISWGGDYPEEINPLYYQWSGTNNSNGVCLGNSALPLQSSNKNVAATVFLNAVINGKGFFPDFQAGDNFVNNVVFSQGNDNLTYLTMTTSDMRNQPGVTLCRYQGQSATTNLPVPAVWWPGGSVYGIANEGNNVVTNNFSISFSPDLTGISGNNKNDVTAVQVFPSNYLLTNYKNVYNNLVAISGNIADITNTYLEDFLTIIGTQKLDDLSNPFGDGVVNSIIENIQIGAYTAQAIICYSNSGDNNFGLVPVICNSFYSYNGENRPACNSFVSVPGGQGQNTIGNTQLNPNGVVCVDFKDPNRCGEPINGGSTQINPFIKSSNPKFPNGYSCVCKDGYNLVDFGKECSDCTNVCGPGNGNQCCSGFKCLCVDGLPPTGTAGLCQKSWIDGGDDYNPRCTIQS